MNKNFSKVFGLFKKNNKIKKSDNKHTEYKTNSIKAIHFENGTKWYKSEYYSEDDIAVSELNCTNSLLNQDCKSIVYFDEKIKCAYIDYKNEGNKKIKCIELRQNGIVIGIHQQDGEWVPYFNDDNNQLTTKYKRQELNKFYREIQGILIKAKQNETINKNTNINAIKEETDEIYFNVIKKIK